METNTEQQTKPKMSLRSLWLSSGLTVLLLAGGMTGGFYLHQSFHQLALAGASKLASAASAKQAAISHADVKDIISQDQKLVVQIDVKVPDGEMIGSGFLCNDKGDLITNAHVVGNASQVTVKMADSTLYTGTVIGKSGDLDIALVRVPSLAGKQPLTLAKDKTAEIGDAVLAFGSPLGLDNSVTTGIISGVNRDFVIKPYTYKNMYQISAPITHGNSGGPLVNQKTGEVIGVNTAGTSEGSIGFAIPISAVIPLVDNWSAHPSADATVAVAAPAPSNGSDTAANDVQSDPLAFQQSAKQIVNTFYENVAARDYASAYALIGSDWQKDLAFDTFQQGYSNTVSVRLTSVMPGTPQDGKVSVFAIVEAQERMASGDQRLSHYKLTYLVGFENNHLRLLSGTAEKI